MHGHEHSTSLETRVYGLELRQKQLCRQAKENREDVGRAHDRITASNARLSQSAESLRAVWALLGRNQDLPERVFRLERWKESTLNIGIGICMALVAVAFAVGGEARKLAMALLGL